MTKMTRKSLFSIYEITRKKQGKIINFNDEKKHYPFFFIINYHHHYYNGHHHHQDGNQKKNDDRKMAENDKDSLAFFVWS